MTRVATTPECPASWHGTGWAFLRWGCRCPEARRDRRSKWHVGHSLSAGPRGAYYPRHRDVDEVAVARATRGELRALALGTREREVAVAALTERRLSSTDIARRLGLAPRSVVRIRQRIRQRAREEHHT